MIKKISALVFTLLFASGCRGAEDTTVRNADVCRMEMNTTSHVWLSHIHRLRVTRVPGGWIYVHKHTDSQAITSTFVPLSYYND